jgi:hypothetical protein
MLHGTTDGFWERHKSSEYETGLPGFLTIEEIDELVDSRKVVEVEGVREREGRYGPMITADFRVGGEVRSKSFSVGAIPSRDVLLSDVRDHLDGGGSPVPVVLERWGAGLGLVAPSEEETVPLVGDTDLDPDLNPFPPDEGGS